MGRRLLRPALMATIAAALLVGSSVASAQVQRWPDVNRGGRYEANDDGFRSGYRQGLRAGEEDGRRNREFRFDNDAEFRNANRGYEGGSREVYRNEFRRGYASGYRDGYERYRAIYYGRNDRGRDDRVRTDNGRWGTWRGYQDPATSRGYDDGFRQGLEDGRDHDRYDPVRHGDYREADQGYNSSYGSKDAYRNNYRAGFRQGYEEGYRDGGRYR